jgi:hypothetical protein
MHTTRLRLNKSIFLEPGKPTARTMLRPNSPDTSPPLSLFDGEKLALQFASVASELAFSRPGVLKRGN